MTIRPIFHEGEVFCCVDYVVCLFLFLALQPIVVVFSQPGNGL